jgi:hypothetical protein
MEKAEKRRALRRKGIAYRSFMSASEKIKIFPISFFKLKENLYK